MQALGARDGGTTHDYPNVTAKSTKNARAWRGRFRFAEWNDFGGFYLRRLVPVMLDTFISPPIMYSFQDHSIVLGSRNLTWPFMVDLP